MKLDLNKSSDPSRFILALMLSTTTALLVAAPFLIVMIRADNEPSLQQEVSETTVDNTMPLPSLGNDESEVGRINEVEPEPEKPAAPQRPAPANPVQEEPEPEPETTTSTTEPPDTTVVAPTTTVAPEETTTTTSIDPPAETSIVEE